MLSCLLLFLEVRKAQLICIHVTVAQRGCQHQVAQLVSLQTADSDVTAAQHLSKAPTLDQKVACQLAADIFGYKGMMRARQDCLQHGGVLRSKRSQQPETRRRSSG